MRKMTVGRFGRLVKIGTGVVIGAAVVVVFCKYNIVQLDDAVVLENVSSSAEAAFSDGGDRETRDSITDDPNTSTSSVPLPETSSEPLPEQSSEPTSEASSEPLLEQSSEPTEAGLININTASAKELQSLPGIGEVKSAAIVSYREEHGAFHSVDELINVNGIGEKTLENIRNLITVGEVEPVHEETSQEPPEPAPININTASAEELQALPGIGEVKSAAIVAYREEHGAFQSVDELINVSGIGEKTLENIRKRVTV